MYHLYLCDIELPQESLPGSLTVKSGGRTKKVELLDGRTISFLKTPGLQEIGLSLSFPMFGARRSAQYYTDIIKKFRNKKQPTQFILTRETPDGKPLEGVNIKVSIGDFSESESADAPNEKQVSLSLLEYVEYETKTVKFKTVGGRTVASITKERETSNAPKASTYTTQDGDTLWKIASKYMGDGKKMKELFAANMGVMTDPNILQPGLELKIPQ